MWIRSAPGAAARSSAVPAEERGCRAPAPAPTRGVRLHASGNRPTSAVQYFPPVQGSAFFQEYELIVTSFGSGRLSCPAWRGGCGEERVESWCGPAGLHVCCEQPRRHHLSPVTCSAPASKIDMPFYLKSTNGIFWAASDPSVWGLPHHQPHACYGMVKGISAYPKLYFGISLPRGLFTPRSVGPPPPRWERSPPGAAPARVQPQPLRRLRLFALCFLQRVPAWRRFPSAGEGDGCDLHAAAPGPATLGVRLQNFSQPELGAAVNAPSVSVQ